MPMLLKSEVEKKAGCDKPQDRRYCPLALGGNSDKIAPVHWDKLVQDDSVHL